MNRTVLVRLSLIFAALVFVSTGSLVRAADTSGAALVSLSLEATFSGGAPIASGLTWRIFPATSAPGKPRPLVLQSTEARPVLSLAQGDYLVHASYGLAGGVQKISLRQAPVRTTLVLNAGTLRINALMGDIPIGAEQARIAIYIPRPGNAEAKLILEKARPGDSVGLPEGSYHLVSTYLDKIGVGSVGADRTRGIPTNSIISANVQVESGKLTDVVLRHHAAVITLKLVRASGAEAIANTSFTILTPGGDVIRELAGAYPSLVLADGEYIVIARQDKATFQSSFTVNPGRDQDAEIIARPDETVKSDNLLRP